MTALKWLLVLVVCVAPMQLTAAEKKKPAKKPWTLADLFKPRPTPRPPKKTRKKSTAHHHNMERPSPRPAPTPTPPPEPIAPPSPEVRYQNDFVVDNEWMARYRILEATWAYEIPEDADIKFISGKYIVPPVVFRHYEDMAKTPRVTNEQNR